MNCFLTCFNKDIKLLVLLFDYDIELLCIQIQVEKYTNI